MSVIINTQALSDFASEGVNTTTMMNLLTTFVSCLGSVQTLEAITYDKTDPDMPTTLSDACKTEWSTQYNIYLQNANTSSISSLDIQCFSCITLLFDLTSSAPLSRQDVIDQITSTLTGYSNTVVEDFFISIQLS